MKYLQVFIAQKIFVNLLKLVISIILINSSPVFAEEKLSASQGEKNIASQTFSNLKDEKKDVDKMSHKAEGGLPPEKWSSLKYGY